MKIAVIGTGYVGLVTGTCFAETGHHVMCVDNNQEKVTRLQKDDIPIFERGLEFLFDKNTRDKRLSFTTELKAAVDFAEIIFLALPTPPGEDGSADLSYVMEVAEELSGLITHYTVIVNKSTVPVGTGEKVKEILLKKLRPEEFDIVSNPEFLREGVAVDDFLRPDRVVIGTQTERATKKLKEL